MKFKVHIKRRSLGFLYNRKSPVPLFLLHFLRYTSPLYKRNRLLSIIHELQYPELPSGFNGAANYRIYVLISDFSNNISTTRTR